MRAADSHSTSAANSLAAKGLRPRRQPTPTPPALQPFARSTQPALRVSWRHALRGELIRWIWAHLFLRWLILLALGLLALPLYINIRQVGDTFISHPAALGWPLFGVTAICAAACWLVLQTAPAAGRRGRWIELR